MPMVAREVEVKYAADDDFEVPPLPELLAGDTSGTAGTDPAAPPVEGEVQEHELRATYFDTDDLRLAAAGLTLRRRTGGSDAGWHLKVPAGPGARDEVRLPPGRATRRVPERLQQLVRAHTRGAPLRPVARLATDRTVHRLVDPTGRVLAELADDRVTAERLVALETGESAAPAATSWREIEVELVDGDEALLRAVDVQLRSRGLREAESDSKLARALGLRRPEDGAGRARADGGRRTPKPATLTPKSQAGDVVLAHLRAQVEQIRGQDLPVRLDAPDSVHKMRVATRRLRSALHTFEPLLEEEALPPLRDELRWLAGELGAARDAEVMRDRVRRAVDAGSASSAREATPAAEDEQLGAAYREAHDRVLVELDGERYHGLLAELDTLVERPPLVALASDPAGDVLPPLVARSYRRLRKRMKEAAAAPEGAHRDELLHEARKAAKRARYAAEAVAPVFGTAAAAFAAAMEEVQEALGELQDSVLTRARLEDLAREASTTQAAFAYGRLHALEEVRVPEVRRHVDSAWRAARRKSLRRWLR